VQIRTREVVGGAVDVDRERGDRLLRGRDGRVDAVVVKDHVPDAALIEDAQLREAVVGLVARDEGQPPVVAAALLVLTLGDLELQLAGASSLARPGLGGVAWGRRCGLFLGGRAAARWPRRVHRPSRSGRDLRGGGRGRAGSRRGLWFHGWHRALNVLARGVSRGVNHDGIFLVALDLWIPTALSVGPWVVEGSRLLRRFRLAASCPRGKHQHHTVRSKRSFRHRSIPPFYQKALHRLSISSVARRAATSKGSAATRF